MASNGNKFSVPPGAQELEISLFGPGIGECIVLHLGFGQWGIVDSCLDPTSKQPAALDYLEALGVDVGASVHFVIATHWHDDHMQGISTIFQRTDTAVFACTGAIRMQDFEALLASWPDNHSQVGGSGIDEMHRIFIELRRRQPETRYPTPILASANKTLWEGIVASSATVKALSPSDAAVVAAMARLSEIGPQGQRARRRLPNLRPNDTSVVLSVHAGQQKMLLGADMEVREDRGLGWLAIVDGRREEDSQHQVLKMSHHGSENGDHAEIWQRMLFPNPLAVTTPFASGRKALPSIHDCQRITTRTKEAYLSAPPIPERFRDPNKAVEKTVREATLSAHFLPGKYGHVRMRKNLFAASDSSWRVELFGDALPVLDYISIVNNIQP